MAETNKSDSGQGLSQEPPKAPREFEQIIAGLSPKERAAFEAENRRKLASYKMRKQEIGTPEELEERKRLQERLRLAELAEEDYANKLIFLVKEDIVKPEQKTEGPTELEQKIIQGRAFLEARKKRPASKLDKLSIAELAALVELVESYVYEDSEKSKGLMARVSFLAERKGYVWIGNWAAGERPKGYVEVDYRISEFDRRNKKDFLKEILIGPQYEEYSALLEQARIGLLTQKQSDLLTAYNIKIDLSLKRIGR